MRRAWLAIVAWTLAAPAWAQGAAQPARLVQAQLSPAPWNVVSGGIAACEAVLDDKGAVVSADVVQDVAPYAAQLRQDILSTWKFEPARDKDRPVGAHVLVLGF